MEQGMIEDRHSAQVLIVGGGMVGMIAALDLAQRGVDVILAEQDSSEPPMVPRANHLSARTMEIFRGLGIADKVRSQGLPDGFANDVAFVTTLTGYELARLRIPSRRKRFNSIGYIDSDWPTSEPAHRCNQMYFEPTVRQEVIGNPRIRTLFGTRIDNFEQDAAAVFATGRNDAERKAVSIRADYVIGCDGGSSTVRKKIGGVFEGVDVISRNRMALVRSPELLGRLTMEPAWMTWFILPEGHGSVHAIDGKELWCFHCTLPEGEEDFEKLDRDKVIRAAMGQDIPYEIVHTEDWFGRRLISDRFSDGRIFLSGDASHIWIPMAGYGMNAGVSDVTNLTWKLAAVLDGWADPAILDSYAVERRPVTEQVSKFVANIAYENYDVDLRQNPPPELYEDSVEGEAVRAEASRFLTDANMGQFNCPGLNFGAVYEGSSIIVPDGEAPPPFELGTYTPTTIPGCRTPHFTLADGTPLYDRMGPGYTLLRTDPAIDVAALVAAAEARSVPLTVLDISAGAADGAYAHKLVLSRPDQYVAWRGNALPDDVMALVDVVRGVVPANGGAGRKAALVATAG
ncbi:FAD-dependent oxidoreductase [Novosphingobium sp.]|uniref:FAD-dependent oxidoreductase n=1 Tax=Novosphingobium sp. TaxID=1874826 RepID=UPI0035AF03CB